MRSQQQGGEGEGGGGYSGNLDGTGKSKYRRKRGPGRATAREWRRPGLSPSREKIPDKKTRTGRFWDLDETSGRMRQVHRGAEGPVPGEPPRGQQGPRCRPRATKGGAHQHRNGGRRRHAAEDGECRVGGDA